MSGVVSGALLASIGVFTEAAGAQPDLASARSKAAALRQQLSRLQLQESVAVERYDGLQDELQQAVSAELMDGDAAVQHQDEARHAREAAAGRARALYMSGGQLGLMTTILGGGSPGDVLERVQAVRSVLSADAVVAETQRLSAAHASATAATSVARRQEVATLREEATASVVAIQTLVARQRTLVREADRSVVRIARAQQRAAEAAALAAADRSATAAGVPADDPSSGAQGDFPAPTAAAATAIAAARSKLGRPYLWGATGPDRFDCSGLTLWSYEQAGVSIPRTSRQQYAGLTHVPLSQLQPGDLVFYATNKADPATIHHVALYIGGGRVIAAPHTGDVVRYAPVAIPGLMGAVRPTA